MKRILPILLLSVLILLGKSPANAQYVLTEADTQFALYNYTKAIDLYEQAYKKKATLRAVEQLAVCYQLQNNYKQAESWYAIASSMAGSKAENTLNYAKVLQNNSKYAEAKAQYQKYATLNKNVKPLQQNIWLLSCDSAMRWMKEPTAVKINNERALNSGQSDWGAVIYQGNTIFASDRGTKGKETNRSAFLKFDGAKNPDKVIYGWTGNHYLKLYQKGNATDSVQLFPLDAGTDYHVGPASFTADGKTMYFTLTRIEKDPAYEKVKNVTGKLATVNIGIYSADQDENGKWSNPKPFKYNNLKEYSSGDPFITADGQSLYFSSNRGGGKGGTDLYVCQKTDAGEWGLPVNLKEVNTEGNERTPLFDAQNNFYFSSDGRIGMGGLDIYQSKLIGGKISLPVNMGYPVNSPQDDFAFTKTTGTTGYLSSNRTEGLGDDDIYSFAEQQVLTFRLTGIVYNRKTNEPLSNAVVSLDQVNGSNLKILTGEDGKFKFILNKDEDYTLNGQKTNFRSDVASLTTKNLNSSTEIKQNLYLEAIELNKEIKLENIYYDFDKWNIRADAAIELDKLVKILKDNPTIWIDLGSHTDSRGNDAYNQSLSQKRAEAAVKYIIEHGIEKIRITAKGYGESRLLNKCSNGVKCSEAEHQSNRRTEFTITKQ